MKNIAIALSCSASVEKEGKQMEKKKSSFSSFEKLIDCVMKMGKSGWYDV